MNKNIFSGPKSWKSNQQDSKLGSSLLMQKNSRFPHTNLVVVTSPKAMKQNPSKKIPKYQRHYSQQDFKKSKGQSNYYYNNITEQTNFNNKKVEEQYFGQQVRPLNKNHKKIHSIEKSERNSSANLLTKQKKKLQIVNNKMSNLKQTSSTQSADNLGISKHIPSFMKTKYSKTNKIHHQEYFHNRLQTPRKTLGWENFKIISKLGEGKFGKVFLVKQIYTGLVLAMKIVEKRKIVKQNLLQQFIKQLKIQSFLDHPNIISFYGFFADQTHFYSLMQLGCDGQLYSMIANNKVLTEQATSFIVKNLLQAINYIHQNKVLHRDIKPQNIVLIMGNVKICDFGWAVNKMFPGDLRSTFCGTPLYLSPQIIQGSLYNQKVDLWAIGILAFQLYFGCTPFDINDQGDLYKIVISSIRFPTNKEISPEFRQFINAMLSKNPNQRLTSKILLSMSFITKYKDFQTCQELCR